MNGEPRPVTISWQRLLVHILFLALVGYLAHQLMWDVFADTWLTEKGSGRRRPYALLIVAVTLPLSWLFNRIYPLAPRTRDAADQPGR